MKQFFFVLFFIFLIPFNFGYDCSYFQEVDYENCLVLNETSEDLIADLIYNSEIIPDHNFIKEYNSEIEVKTSPDNTLVSDVGFIKEAWIKILSIEPSVLYNDTLYVPQTITLRSEYNYKIEIPKNYYNSKKRNGDVCKLKYYLESQTDSIDWYGENQHIGDQKQIHVSLYGVEQVKAQTTITATTKVKKYVWDKYCCSWGESGCNRYCYDCDYRKTYYLTDSITIEDTKSIKPYDYPFDSEFKLYQQYQGTFKGNITPSPDANTFLSTDNSYYAENKLFFKANFTNKPFYFLQLQVFDQDEKYAKNLIVDNKTIYLPEITNCQIQTTTFFETNNNTCEEDYQELALEPFQREKFTANWGFIIKLAIFFLTLVLLYRVISKYWNKALVPITAFLLMPTIVKAETCGLTNLASCIPQKIYEFFLNLLNAPLAPLLDLTKNLLTAHPGIEVFQGLWGIMVYVLSMFFGLLFIYSGFQFLFSGHNVIKREMAKQWLKNTVIMIVLIQSSFYLYDLMIQLGSIMSSTVLSLVDPLFFMLTANNIINIGLEFLFTLFYAITLMITILFLGMRYLMVALGVVFVPIGIFCYFIPPLKSYGRLILNILGMNIFITFIASIIILACSMMVEIPIFENIKILVMINCFTIVNLLFILLTKHVIKKSAVGDGAEKMAEAAKYIAMFV